MIGTLGPEGTYSHQAALKLGGDVVFYDGVHEIAEAVVSGVVESGVVPIENSIEGSVNATLDVLTDYDVYITSEIVVEVHHALIAGSEDFTEIVSHPQALAQCRSYLKENYPDVDLRSVSSTARGVEVARREGVAAIAHPSLADRGLEVIAEDIQDKKANSTRFVRLDTEPSELGGGKTTVILYPGEDRPGLLYDILGVFKERGINLTRIESRPSKRELGDYVFHIDFIAGDVEEVLEELEDVVEWVDYLGTYGKVD